MNKQFKADFSLLLVTIVWGSSFILMKNILSDVSSFAYLSLRFSIASIFMAIIFYKYLPKLNKKVLFYGGVVGVFLFAGMALQVVGLNYTTASKSAFITGLYVVLVPIFSSIILRKFPDISSIIGVALAFGGLILLTNSDGGKVNLGDVLTIISAICFTFQIIFIDKFTNQESPILIAVIQVAVTALLSTFVWLFIDFKPVNYSSNLIMVLLITGLLGTAGAFTIQTVVQKYTSPTHTVLIFSAEPVFGALFASIIPGTNGLTEVLTISAKVGSVLILGGILISELKFNFLQKKKEES
jgi:drug/metabolite transporter (DMT)-like permease